jgi:hypothetical protein
MVLYTCERGHPFTVTFAATATAPSEWECRCGHPATQAPPEPGPGELERRMEQVRSRRTDTELEALIASRLAEARGSLP